MKRSLLKYRRRWLPGLVIAAFLLFWPPGVSAGMEAMPDHELEAITGQVLTFRIEDRTVGGTHQAAVLLLDMRIEMQVSLRYFKFGYYVDGFPGSDWDVHMENVRFGTPAEPFVLDGLRIELGFTNIHDPAIRELLFVKIGSDRTSGMITHRLGYPHRGFFQQFSVDIRASCTGMPGIEIDVNVRRGRYATYWIFRYWFNDVRWMRFGDNPGDVRRLWIAAANVDNTTAIGPWSVDTFPGRGFWMHIEEAMLDF